MWVRSQDKNRLVDTTNLCICFDKDICSLSPIGNGESIRIWLATYSTREKALKVLDLLEKYIGGKENLYIVKDPNNPRGAYEVLNNMYTTMAYCKNGIFQMPQDNEV